MVRSGIDFKEINVKSSDVILEGLIDLGLITTDFETAKKHVKLLLILES